MGRDLKSRTEELLQLARRTGVTQHLLRQPIHDLVCGHMSTDNLAYADLWRQADDINKAGLRSQVGYLIEALGYELAKKKISELSTPLDTFTRHVTSEEEPPIETEEELDEDGDPWE